MRRTKLIRNILYNEINFQYEKIILLIITSDFILRIEKRFWGDIITMRDS